MSSEAGLEKFSSLLPVETHTRQIPDSQDRVRYGLAQLFIQRTFLRKIIGGLILEKQTMHHEDELCRFFARQRFRIGESIQNYMCSLLVAADFGENAIRG